MKPNITIIFLVILFQIRNAARAADYNIDWQVIASAGGNASGGAYTLRDTLGEMAAHRTTAAPSSAIDGGFWALWSPASFGVPELNIERLGAATVRLSWTPEGGGWLLQRSSDLGTWHDLTPTSPADDALAPGGAFYRLILP